MMAYHFYVLKKTVFFDVFRSTAITRLKISLCWEAKAAKIFGPRHSIAGRRCRRLWLCGGSSQSLLLCRPPTTKFPSLSPPGKALVLHKQQSNSSVSKFGEAAMADRQHGHDGPRAVRAAKRDEIRPRCSLHGGRGPYQHNDDLRYSSIVLY